MCVCVCDFVIVFISTGCSISSRTLVGLTLILDVTPICLILHGQVGFLRKRLSNWARWWNIPNLSQPNQGIRPPESPCTILMDYLLQRECTLCRPLCRPRRRQVERLPHHGHQAAVLGGALRQSLNASEFSSGYPTA